MHCSWQLFFFPALLKPLICALCFLVAMEKVQYITRSALRRASTIEVNPQARQRLQELFVNFCLILICLLLICIIVMLLWSSSTPLHCPLGKSPQREERPTPATPNARILLWEGLALGLELYDNHRTILFLPATCIKNTLLCRTVFRACCYKAVHDLTCLSQSRDVFSEWGKVLPLHGVGKFLNVLARWHKQQLHFWGGLSVFFKFLWKSSSPWKGSKFRPCPPKEELQAHSPQHILGKFLLCLLEGATSLHYQLKAFKLFQWF